MWALLLILCLVVMSFMLITGLLTQNYCQCIQGTFIGHVGNSSHVHVFLDLLPCLVLAFG